MSTPGVGPITAGADHRRLRRCRDGFRSSASAGAYLGLTPQHYESSEVSHNGRISKRGDEIARTHLYEAANAIMTGKLGASRCATGPSRSPSAPAAEGQGRPGAPRAGGDPARHVAHRRPLPRRGDRVGAADRRPARDGAPPRDASSRDAGRGRDRSSACGPSTARHGWIRADLNAETCGARAATAERTREPGQTFPLNTMMTDPDADDQIPPKVGAACAA